MKYDEVKERLLKLKENNQLISNCKINKATTIIDPVKFLNSHFTALENLKSKSKRGEKVSSIIANNYMDRLIKYLEICEKK